MNIRFFHKVRKQLLCSVLILLFVGAAYDASATHAAGADLTYRCLGGMQYELIATFYRDCSGTPEPNTVTINYASASCSYSRMAIATKTPGPNGEEVTMPCATSTSSCNGGLTTGLRKWVYKAVVTLPFACNDWVMSYRVCCRNCTITTIQSPCASGSELYVESVLNNLDAPCNSSPMFNNDPVVFICVGQNFNFNQGVYDIDGDSLSYELITPKTSADNDVTFTSPMSTQSPLLSSTPFTVDQITGDINFTPSSIQIGIIAVRINEYRNGQFIGSSIRDMQVYTQNCFNNIPSVTGIDSSSVFSITACAGENICFTIYTADADTNQTISVEYDNLPSGSIITESGGVRPQLEFCWTPTEADISSNPKIFSVSVRDNACPLNSIQTYSYTIMVGGPQLSVTTTNPDCVNPNTGTATVSGSGLSGGTIVWNTIPQQNTPIASGLSSGNYEVVVTDIHGCSAIAQAIISPNLNSVSAIATGSGLITCQSGNVGAGTVSLSGGTAPYFIEWSNGETTQSISGLSGGIYTVTVTDSVGCMSSDTILINELTNDLGISLTATENVFCYGDNTGSAEVNASGGVAPYNYIWNNGEATPTIGQLPAGQYTVTVTDNNGCTNSSSVTITQPAGPLEALTNGFSNVSCFNDSTGHINLIVNGGTSPYTFNWSNGVQTPDNLNLPAGSYTAVITDANGCTDSVSQQIQQPVEPVVLNLMNKKDVSCFENSDGEIEVSASGGESPYSFLWNTGSTNNVVSGLQAGDYTVTVTDNNGCTAVTNSEIIQPQSAVSGSISIVNQLSCEGISNGSAVVNGTGGTGSLNYLWSNGSTGPDLNNIGAGVYTVTITDQAGCVHEESVTFQEPGTVISITGSSIGSNCITGTGGSITTNIIGGTPPLSFIWSSGDTLQNITNVSPGNYQVVVTDINGCSVTENFIVNNSNELNLITSGNDTICSGELTTLTVDSVSGAAYQWYFNGSILNGATGNAFTTPAEGYYTVSVTNSCGTFESDTMHVIVKSIGNVSVSNQQIICPPETATLVATGGTRYQWSPSTYITFTNVPDPIVSPLNTTTYTVDVINEFGCKTSLSTVVAVVCDSLLVPTGFSPNDDGTNDGYVIEGIEDYPGNKLWVYNRWGRLVYKAVDYMNSWDGVSNISGVFEGRKVPTGTYYYILDLNDRSKPKSGYLIIRH